MTLQELYENIGGDFDQASKTLRVEKLIDKHIRRFASSEVVTRLLEAGKSMDATELFETAHAAKGVCGNLGLRRLADLTTIIADEFRPGNDRTLSDEEVREKLDEIGRLFEITSDGIREYAGE